MQSKWISNVTMLGAAACLQLLSIPVFAQIGSAPLALGDILRDSDGRIRRMNQYDAERTCLEQGTRLPTARELATYSQSLGACGILSPNEYASFENTKYCQKWDYKRIQVAASATEPADDFYFNRLGYQRPAGDLGIYWFWSSSVYPESSRFWAYQLGGLGGGVWTERRSWFYFEGGAVRCVQ